MDALKTTPLTAWHVAKGAKMAAFAGFSMPIQYEGIIAEHHHTRRQAAVFDICHMGEFMVRGPGAAEALGKILTQNFATLAAGRCRYGFVLNERGGILDDLIVYCLTPGSEYMLVVNGACESRDFDWIAGHLPAGVAMENVSEQTAKIDLQGPKAHDALEALLGSGYKGLPYFGFGQGQFDGAPLIVSRTGYTGELGYEFYLPAAKAPALWEGLLATGFVKPAGLGARDTLRLEAGYPLYGQDLDEQHTPVEAGYGFVLTSEAEFIGKQALGEVREKLVALSIPGRRSARHDDVVASRDGKAVGRVTSGSFSPTLEHCVALAYVAAPAAEAKEFIIRGARSELSATRVELPFYSGTARQKLA